MSTSATGPRWWQSIRVTLEMIKIEHTLFALPFALLGAVAAARGTPEAWTLLWITVAMVGARSAAMAFNRLVDRHYDSANPRTATRALPAGDVSVAFVRAFTIVSVAVFVAAAAMLNWLTLALSPVALVSVLGYSFTKRFTSMAHIALGWALSIAPAGAWIAVRGDLTVEPVLLSAAVMLWTGGFDVLYACQDTEFDRSAGLYSIPSRVGVARALWIARGLHVLMFAALVGFYILTGSGMLGLAGVVATGVLLVYQHAIVRASDLSRLNAAFFTTNAFVSVILLATIGGGILLAG
ncbi:MAG: UbiA family prenyltransferase [Blastocatellia bacterium]|nr:UbiA family prenyltransferase [Blastocatellia bacterium]